VISRTKRYKNMFISLFSIVSSLRFMSDDKI